MPCVYPRLLQSTLNYEEKKKDDLLQSPGISAMNFPKAEGRNFTFLIISAPPPHPPPGGEEDGGGLRSPARHCRGGRGTGRP